MAFLVDFILLFIACSLACKGDAAGLQEVPRMEIISRLADDMFGSCRYEILPGALFESNAKAGLDGVNSDSTINVYAYPPSDEEVQKVKLLPETLTHANTALGTSARAIRWGNLKNQMWQIPANHPRQNKQYCVDLAKQAGKSVMAFYTNSSVNAASTFFLMHIRGEVAVHEMGIAARPCGYTQPVQSCETMFKFIGRNWAASCKQNLTMQGQKWGDMFRERSSEGEGTLTLVSSLASHSCFPAEEVRPGKRQRAQGVQPYFVYQQVHRVKRVFVAAAQWDNNYHHFIVDTLSKIVRHLDWLQANPDIFIHIRAYERLAKKERYIEGGKLLRKKIFELLGVDVRRILYGNVLADEVFLPRCTRCNEPLSHAFELRLLAERMKAAADAAIVTNPSGQSINTNKEVDVGGGFTVPIVHGENVVDDDAYAVATVVKGNARRLALPHVTDDFVDDDGHQGIKMPLNEHGQSTTGARTGGAAFKHRQKLSKGYPVSKDELQRPLLLIQHRVCSTPEDCAKTWREFSDHDMQRLVNAFLTHYGDNYRIAVVADSNKRLTECVACQIRLYKQADVLVGIHGAGLTNIMFMKPGAVLIELTGEFDGRMTPVCGYHGPLAAAFGIHHFLYFWEWKDSGRKPPSDADLDELAMKAYQFGLAVGSK